MSSRLGCGSGFLSIHTFGPGDECRNVGRGAYGCGCTAGRNINQVLCVVVAAQALRAVHVAWLRGFKGGVKIQGEFSTSM